MGDQGRCITCLHYRLVPDSMGGKCELDESRWYWKPTDFCSRYASCSKPATLDVQAFNAACPPGTRVIYRPWIGCPEGERVITRTRSEAWLLGHGEPVVKIEGRAGGVCLSHLEVLKNGS